MNKEKIWNYHTFNSEDVDYISDNFNTSKTIAKVLHATRV